MAARHRNRFRKHSPLSQEQILENEIKQKKEDFDRTNLLFQQAKQKLETTQFIVEQAHQLNIHQQMNIVSDLSSSLQHMQRMRVQQHQAEINRYGSYPYQVLVFASGWLGANMVPAQLTSQIRDEQRRRDIPSEQERWQLTVWQHEQRKLEHLQRTSPPETPELRQERDKVRAIENQLLSLSRQIRDKEIQLESIRAAAKAAAPPAP